MKILITGAAGFIGFHTARYFAEKGDQVVGVDNINDYYDVELKYNRLQEIGINRELIHEHKPERSTKYGNCRFFKADLLDKEFIDRIFRDERFDAVCHLAAQVGVRYSINNPYAYINSNILGFLNILEACRFNPLKHLVYASSSSVYGLNEKIPYSETDLVDAPLSLYAASKKSNELMAHAYSKLYNIPATGVRFFTVYGPWGRPDMAPYIFMDSIIKQVPINVFNHGNLYRDFTYIDDIVKGLSLIIENPPVNPIPYKIYNIGHGKPMRLTDFIAAVESITGKSAIKKMVEMQDGDVYQTYADTSALEYNLKYKPYTSIYEGLDKFYDWYVRYSKRMEKNLTYQEKQK